MSNPATKIAVTFIDNRTSETICFAELTPEQLPETFEGLETTLHLQEQDWTVALAVPTNRSGYVQTGRLTLRLNRVEKLDPKEILYSLPSICDGIPGLSDQPLSPHDYRLADDGWRQLEFIDHGFAALADEEIRNIRRIHEEASAEVGWREIHVRKGPEPPIARQLALSDVVRHLGVSSELAGVTYYGAEARIADGFSFALPAGPKLYGLAPGGNVQVLALAHEFMGKYDSQSIDSLARLAHAFDLDLVQWCRCVRARWNEPMFANLLAANM
jgi:hypothetical protein